MNTDSPTRKLRRLPLLIAAVAIAVTAVAPVAAGGEGDGVAAIRTATAPYHDLNVALADGYVPFYKCTEQPGVGTMGQHYVRLDLVGDPAVDPLHPEALVYEPKPGGGSRLVAVEYVVLAPTLPEGAPHPSLLGKPMKFVPGTAEQPNRYGLPDFYEIHVWLWDRNPLGTYNDWNPRATCRGNGDNGG
jgi:hypothetical protein